ncbi:sugar phosphate isomerase/epimerase [Croceitalea sp. MTPC5]|uniref:sugar phosphate isomerase/epimerase family protein n=1 Tax=Croceitalea sp. MTPC5 TaxID=3056565 RepID=UPI002B3EA500|nr:sugar phosphate isomerase/epimerase [Croceitalea sp. MTPC5]
MKRRAVIKKGALAAGAMAVLPSFKGFEEIPKGRKLGVQLFTIPKMIDVDLKGTLSLIGELGYQEVEFFGPYPFSTLSAKQDWNQIKPMLGIRNDAFYGFTIEEVSQMLKDNGLTVPSMHTDFDTLRKRLDSMLDEVAKLDTKYLVLPAIQEEKNTLDHYKRFVDEFNLFGEKMAKYDMQFVYHNHGYEHMVLDGEVPMDFLLKNTNPDHVKFELDIFWMQAAGADPISYLKAYPNSYRLLHLKDASKEFRFSGDGQTPDQWMAGFPFMSDPGDGVYDIKGIIAQAEASGVEHYFLERDLAPNPEETLKNSYKNLKKFG